MDKGTFSYVTSGDAYADENRPKGGFNGGGKGSSYYDTNEPVCGSSGGSGSTDIRFDKSDLWHRVIVSGGGGGSDNPTGTYKGGDDGSGGAGGGLIAQGFWINGQYNGDHLANQTFGFTFGNGESAQKSKCNAPHGVQTPGGNTDRAGAGGGWFGGFASHHGNGGAGDGSSFVLTNDAVIPSRTIESRDSYYSEDSANSNEYAFKNHPSFTFFEPIFVPGIWKGDGLVRIEVIILEEMCTFHCAPRVKYLTYAIINICKS